MEDLQDPAPPARHKKTPRRLWADIGNRPPAVLPFALLAGISAGSLIVLVIVWRLHPSHDSLGFELAKTCMQALGVIIVGAMAGIATFTYQQKHLRADEDRDRELEQRRREVDRIVDERRRQDELLRSVLEDTLTAYHAVKRARRLLDAEAGPEHNGPVSLDTYDQHMLCIMNEQLKFEKLMILANLIDDPRIPTGSWPDARRADKNKPRLVAMFSKIEKSLNDVVDEYKKKRQEVAEAGSIPLSQLIEAYTFVTSDGFEKDVACPKDAVLGLLQKALLQPISLPAVAEGAAASPQGRRERQLTGPRPEVILGPKAPLPAAETKNGDGKA